MWRVRNFEQLRETPTAIFFTGTVSPERYDYIKEKYELKTDNEIITKIHRLFLERIRKETGKSSYPGELVDAEVVLFMPSNVKFVMGSTPLG